MEIGPQGPANGPNGRRKRPQNPKNGVFRVRAGNFEGLFSVALGSSVACDDKAARKVIVKVLGEDRLTGSIGLLRETVKAGLLTQAEAFAAYCLMRERGGFLPAIDQADF